MRPRQHQPRYPYRYFPNKTALLQAAGVSSEELTNQSSTREHVRDPGSGG
ncbi:MAG: hypothetical protein R2838_09380 [Caldilineaceae bacterium]